MAKRKPDSLPMWTIYERPTDYPNHFVVRRCDVFRGVVVHHHDCHLADNLEAARKLVPPGLHNLGRFQDDEPQIVETWV